MQNHVDSWKEATAHYGVPEDLSRKANMHHLNYDGVGSYPKEFADIKEEAIPIEARIQSLFDSSDAAGANRYGKERPKTYDKFMSKMGSKWEGGPSIIGTQFDPELFKMASDGGISETTTTTYETKKVIT